MRLTSTVFLGLALFLFACNKDDDGTGIEASLHYDGPNANAPVLGSGNYEAAARFTDFELNEFIDQEITEVLFFYAGIPASTQIRIYAEGSDGFPGNTILYQAGISSSLSSASWNTHRVRNPVEITGDNIWISLVFTQNSNLQSIGCDAGPGHEDGQWMYQSSTNQWERFVDISGENINWNIRLRIE